MKRPPITTAQRLHVLKRFGAVVLCQICGNPEYVAVIQIDHELPLIFGGEHDADTNLRPVCVPCHARKSAKETIGVRKADRVAKKHSNPKPAGKIKSRPFDTKWRKRMNGQVEKRND